MAALVFLAVALVSAWRLPPVDLRWEWLGVAVALLLVSVVILAGEYWLSGWLIGRRVGPKEALRVTIFSSVANLLPLPGGVAVRVGALRSKGSAWTSALGSNVVVAIGWLGVALLLAGVLLHGQASRPVVVGFTVCGLAALIAMGAALERIATERPLLLGAALIVLLEGVYVAVSAARIWAVLAGLGIAATFAQATTLTVASALAAGLGFFPGGLGLRELLAGGLAPLAGLAPAVGAFAGVVDRIVGMCVRAVLAAILWIPRAGRAGSGPEVGEPGEREGEG